MLTRDQAADIFSRIRKHATADEVECLFYGGKSALTRFAIFEAGIASANDPEHTIVPQRQRLSRSSS